MAAKNMMGRKCPLWVAKRGLQAAARKLDEKDEMNEVIAKWKEVKQIRKTDVEETEATTRRSVGKPLETPDRRSQSPKGAVQRTCSSAGHSCGSARRRVVTKEK